MKRKAAILISMVALHALSTAGIPALAINLTGTAGDDVIFGGAGADQLDGGSAIAGDLLFGKANPRPRTVGGRRVTPKDRLTGLGSLDGGSGKDILGGLGTAVDDDGTPGDVINGQFLVFAADGAADKITCQPFEGSLGLAFVDTADTVAGCGIVIRQSTGWIANQLGGFVYIATYGTASNDTFTATNQGSFGHHVVFGLAGNDTITLAQPGSAFPGPGADTVHGSTGGDILWDGDGLDGDTLNGGGGADRIFAADGAHTTIDCGAGDSAIDYVVKDPDDTLTASCVSETIRQGTDVVVAG